MTLDNRVSHREIFYFIPALYHGRWKHSRTGMGSDSIRENSGTFLEDFTNSIECDIVQFKALRLAGFSKALVVACAMCRGFSCRVSSLVKSSAFSEKEGRCFSSPPRTLPVSLLD